MGIYDTMTSQEKQLKIIIVWIIFKSVLHRRKLVRSGQCCDKYTTPMQNFNMGNWGWGFGLMACGVENSEEPVDEESA